MEPTTRRAPLTVARALDAAEILGAVIDGTHPVGQTEAARRLARTKLRELLEECGGLARIIGARPGETLIGVAQSASWLEDDRVAPTFLEGPVAVHRIDDPDVVRRDLRERLAQELDDLIDGEDVR